MHKRNYSCKQLLLAWSWPLLILAVAFVDMISGLESVERKPEPPKRELLYSCDQIFRNLTIDGDTATESDEDFLMTGSSSCRCFDGTPGIVNEQPVKSNANEEWRSGPDPVIDNTAEATGSLPWLGCTRATMPQILKAFRRLTPTAKLGKLWLWDNVMPLVPGMLFANISTQRLILETSGVVDFNSGALQSMGNQLGELELRNNEIGQLSPGVFAGLSSLKRLCLNSNRLTTIQVGSFDSLTALNYLALQQNRIKSIDDGSFRQLQALQTLDLSHNQLRVITGEMFAGLESLEILSLEGNMISSFDMGAFSYLKNLKSLNLAGNNLSQFVVDQLPSLEKLYLSNNSFRSMSDIDLSVHQSLRVLHLDKNDISDLSGEAFRDSGSLIILSLTNNQIQNFSPGSFTGLTKLETLSLQQNVIEELPTGGAFVSTPQLRRLFLSHNRLGAIGSGCFRGLQLMRSLNLGHNRIDAIAQDVFDGLFSLEKLYLNDNLLQSVDNETFSGLEETLQALDLSNNPWQCDCDHTWFLEWFSERAGSQMLKPDDTVCGVPDPAGAVASGDDTAGNSRKEQMSQVRVSLEEAFSGLEARCSSGVMKVPITTVTHTGITILACALGTLSIMILIGVALLFWQDHLTSADKVATGAASGGKPTGKHVSFSGNKETDKLSSTSQDVSASPGNNICESNGGLFGAANNRLHMGLGIGVDGSGPSSGFPKNGSSMASPGSAGARPKKQVTIRMPPDMVKLLPTQDNSPPGSVSSNINQI